MIFGEEGSVMLEVLRWELIGGLENEVGGYLVVGLRLECFMVY